MSTLERYLTSQIAAGLLVAALVLLPLFAFLDLVDQLDDVGKGFFRARDAFLCVILLLPRRLVQLAPFIALIGNVMALGRLAISSELIAMRAAGLSPLQIGVASLKTGVVLVVLVLFLEQFIAPPMQQQALMHRSRTMEQSTELGRELGIWTRDGQHIVRIANPEQVGAPAEVEILRLDSDGFVREFLFARQADMGSDDAWQLRSVTRKIIDQGWIASTIEEAATWKPFLSRDQIATLTRPAESLSPLDLYRYTRHLRATGQQADAYSLALWKKFGGTLTLVAMILLSVSLALGSARSGIGTRLTLAATAGIGVYLLDQIISNAGLLLGMNPAPVALAPGLIFVAAALFLLRRVH